MHQRRTLLSQPLFLMALVVLVVNDHVLKGAGILPGSITGKLSDFAGLIVAPVLGVALLRLRGHRARVLVFACVAVGFATIKLSRPAARLVEALTAFTYWPWKLWCDPTDLLALSVLPLAWWLAERRREPWPPRLSVCLQRMALVLGVFACAATSIAEDHYVFTAFLSNATARAQSVRLYRVNGPLDCARSIESPSVWPGADAFVLESCTTLGSGDFLPLDKGWRKLDAGAGPPDLGSADAGASQPGCDAVLVDVDGLEPAVISWSGASPGVITNPDRFAEVANDDRGVCLEQAGERLFIKGTSLVKVVSAGFTPAPTPCPNGER